MRVAPAFLLFCCSIGAAPPSRPFVVLISVDTLRADRLGCYGFRGVPTTNIDQLTHGGTLFSQASAQVPLTLPSHASFLTSTYPFAAGVNDNGQVLPPNSVTIAQVMKAAGYRTAAFVGGFVLDRRFGLDRGFDVYDSPFDLHGGGSDPGDIKRPSREVTRAASEWVERNAGYPFFLFVHLYDLHTPYSLPHAVRSRYRSGYEAELAYVDEVIGEFLDFLRARGLFRQALIILTSDHGEGLGDHGESTHGYFVYQSTLRVPLILHWPAASPPRPARIDVPVPLLGLAPTILEFAGVPRPPQMQGQSLFAAPSPDDGGIYGESLYGQRHFGTSTLRSLRAGHYKYVQCPKPELYDVSHDPGETENLYVRQKAMALSLDRRLNALRSRFQARGQASTPSPNPEALARLRSLGYLGSSEPASVQQADPKDRIAAFERHGRALELASAGRLQESNRQLAELIRELPDLPDLRLSLGVNLQEMGRHKEAAQEFRDALRQIPRDPLAHFDLGVSLVELSQVDDAIRELEATLALAPHYTRADELLGSIYVRRKDLAKARQHFQHILSVSPDDYTAHFNLGALAAMDGHWAEGERHLQAALRLRPRAPEAYNTLGSLYLRSGDLDQARSAFQNALRLNSRMTWAHYNLGLVFRKQGKIEDASREFRAALAQDPQFAAARAALAHMEARPK